MVEQQMGHGVKRSLVTVRPCGGKTNRNGPLTYSLARSLPLLIRIRTAGAAADYDDTHAQVGGIHVRVRLPAQIKVPLCSVIRGWRQIGQPGEELIDHANNAEMRAMHIESIIITK